MKDVIARSRQCGDVATPERPKSPCATQDGAPDRHPGSPRRRLLLLAMTIAATAATASAAEQTYPVKPIRLIVPFAPGGPVDALARILAPQLSATFKQSVVVDNRPGASGMIGI